MHYNDYALNVNRKVADGYGGVGYYRIVKIGEHLKKHGFDVTIIGGVGFDAFGKDVVERFDNIFKEYDIFWMPYFYNDQSAAAMYSMRDKHGKKVIIDLDDNYFDVPESNQLYKEFSPGKKSRAFLSTILFFADYITVSTYPLKERIHDHFMAVDGTVKDITVIPNLNDIEDWNYEAKEREDDTIIIGYAGSTSHKDDLKLVLPHIVRIMKKYPQVTFEMMGLLTKDEASTFFKGIPKDILDRMGMIGATDMYSEYPKFLANHRWDIGIAPLVDTAFTRCKSSIKWLEYSMYKVPVVASRVYPYFMDVGGRMTVQDGITGLLCKSKEWTEKLERLINDKQLRRKLGNQAYEFIRDNWQYKDSTIHESVAKILS